MKKTFLIWFVGVLLCFNFQEAMPAAQNRVLSISKGAVADTSADTQSKIKDLEDAESILQAARYLYQKQLDALNKEEIFVLEFDSSEQPAMVFRTRQDLADALAAKVLMGELTPEQAKNRAAYAGLVIRKWRHYYGVEISQIDKEIDEIKNELAYLYQARDLEGQGSSTNSSTSSSSEGTWKLVNTTHPLGEGTRSQSPDGYYGKEETISPTAVSIHDYHKGVSDWQFDFTISFNPPSEIHAGDGFDVSIDANDSASTWKSGYTAAGMGLSFSGFQCKVTTPGQHDPNDRVGVGGGVGDTDHVAYHCTVPADAGDKISIGPFIGGEGPTVVLEYQKLP